MVADVFICSIILSLYLCLKPSRPISSNGVRDDHAKRKQVAKRRFDEDDEEDPLAMIRNMFGYFSR